jgi:RNA polymerase sigma factor (sigma-70 family)
MASGQWGGVFRQVQRLFQGGSVSGLTECQLLERFASDRDELAFGALLARHGPMVLGVCRGVLDDPNDVDDAFQATFLVLVKKAGALRDGDRLAQWLYGVARKVSLRARSAANRKKARERPGAEEAADPHPTLDADLRELQSLIREEVDRLSSNDRMAVVLCYLEGLTHEEAADRLGWPVGTVKGRLSRARDKLRERLTRRGVALPAAAVASTIASNASAAVPPALIRSTTLAAIELATGKTLTAGIVSAHAITLMEGAIGTMFTTKLKIAATALVATCVVGVPGVLAYQQGGFPVDKAGKAPVEVRKGTTIPGQDLATSKLVEPGTDTSRQEMAVIAEDALKILDQQVAQGQAATSTEEFYVWSRRLAEAKAGPTASKPDQKAALEAHRQRMRKLTLMVARMKEAGQRTEIDLLNARYRQAEAYRWARDERIGDITANPPVDPGFGGIDESPPRQPLVIKTMPGDEKRNQAILAKLEENLAMNFAMDTPLSDVKKYLEEATLDEKAGLPKGIPIYVDPLGLKLANKTMADTVTIQFEGIPLRTTLRLLLHQLGLAYRVEGGLLLITNEDVPGLPGGRPANSGGLGRGNEGGGFR